jgi:hypothetical protein
MGLLSALEARLKIQVQGAPGPLVVANFQIQRKILAMRLLAKKSLAMRVSTRPTRPMKVQVPALITNLEMSLADSAKTPAVSTRSYFLPGC